MSIPINAASDVTATALSWIGLVPWESQQRSSSLSLGYESGRLVLVRATGDPVAFPCQGVSVHPVGDALACIDETGSVRFVIP